MDMHETTTSIPAAATGTFTPGDAVRHAIKKPNSVWRWGTGEREGDKRGGKRWVKEGAKEGVKEGETEEGKPES